jgi:amino acid transporter
MSMSRDGLLPKAFSRIHPKYHTPSFSTIVTGFVVAIPALFMNLTEVTNLTSIGTLFAFVLVCGGVLLLPKEAGVKGRFKMPYINSKFITPALFIAGVIAFNEQFMSLFSGDDIHKNFPYFLFVLLAAALTIASFIKNLSLIPVLGLLSCFYLMAALEYESWIRFLVWLVIGLVIYFSYSYKNSVLAKQSN